MAFNRLISFILLSDLSVTLRAIKKNQICIFFISFAYQLIYSIFHISTILRYYGNYISEEYPTKCVVMCS